MKLIQGDVSDGYGDQEINDLMDRISQDMEKLEKMMVNWNLNTSLKKCLIFDLEIIHS